ncbi:Aldo-keto reductase family 4 member C8 [Camellia lanceoleosa]|uniref:Aldo-keto reductase family 4 member C8 n=1 Tax=Camellia lanceoleosa TaxID=1840588 RepID=A0ACC0GAS5_9ERIC|nr:Aldo-keto reductase family 4 member C8 [Camellia lanceoleosa]
MSLWVTDALAISGQSQARWVGILKLWLLCLPETWAAMEGLYASGQARGQWGEQLLQQRSCKTCSHMRESLHLSCQPGGMPPLVWQQPALHNLCKSTGVHLR